MKTWRFRPEGQNQLRVNPNSPKTEKNLKTKILKFSSFLKCFFVVSGMEEWFWSLIGDPPMIGWAKSLYRLSWPITAVFLDFGIATAFFA